MFRPVQAIAKRGIGGAPLLVAAAVAVVSLGACATVPPPPTQALQAAESAITNAEQSRVADYASAELTQSREKLRAARTAVQNQQMREAEFLAIESRVHAELAYAQAEEIKAKAVNDEMQRSLDTLRSEMNRSRGAPQ
ncbi:MAG: DUF4398 domain-containing protein [Gammaproteobacteria bacterium]|nr:DUF4398 domain-containing protein [Gammaproteobacteria bacterium]TVQ48484.1 MAG: DUF4398 domain-containing protein [Gammaproteobacteria bacterium]